MPPVYLDLYIYIHYSRKNPPAMSGCIVQYVGVIF